MIHYIPIENIEQRYTKLMNEIVYPHCHYIYYPSELQEVEIKKGQFLDVERTIQFKARQIEMISIAFQEGKVKDGDWFLFGDMFFPAIESIKYMAELQDIKIKIAGFNYAGRSDEFDFVRKLDSWSDIAELTYHSVCDLVFVGSEFHKKNVVNYFNQPESKIIVTGYIWDVKEAYKLFPYKLEKEDFVIFPHRVSSEKGIDDLIEIANLMPNTKFIITSSSSNDINIDLPKNIEYINKLSKKEYYSYMSRAKYYLSTAYQETFGYTLREALMYGCIIAVPNRVCYPEMIPESNLFNDNKEVERIFNEGYIMKEEIVNMYSDNIKKVMSYLN